VTHQHRGTFLIVLVLIFYLPLAPLHFLNGFTHALPFVEVVLDEALDAPLLGPQRNFDFLSRSENSTAVDCHPEFQQDVHVQSRGVLFEKSREFQVDDPYFFEKSRTLGARFIRTLAVHIRATACYICHPYLFVSATIGAGLVAHEMFPLPVALKPIFHIFSYNLQVAVAVHIRSFVRGAQDSRGVFRVHGY